MILSTGVEYRQLDAPGLATLTGCGVFYGSALTEAAGCTGSDVYIVGGANSAGQAAVYLARARPVGDLLVRGPSLTVSMSHYLIEQVEQGPQHHRAHLHRGRRRRAVTTTWRGSRSATPTPAPREEVAASWLFVFIGAAPLTDWLDGVVLRDEHGFVVAGPDLPVGGQLPAGWSLDRPPVPPGDQRSRRVRGRRRPRRVRQAGRLRRRRGRHGRHARPSLPGEAVTADQSSPARLSAAGRAAFPVPVREARRRPARLAVPGGPRRDDRGRPRLHRG